MSLESADPHDPDVPREKIEPWENSWKMRLIVVYDVTTFYRAISYT